MAMATGELKTTDPTKGNTMSWSYQKAGRASKLAEVVKQQIIDTQGCPKGSAEEAAKNQIGEVLETLCKSFGDDKAIKISANGSAWTEGDKARSQYLKVEFETLGDFVE
jgi:L-lactate utilization protein LutC